MRRVKSIGWCHWLSAPGQSTGSLLRMLGVHVHSKAIASVISVAASIATLAPDWLIVNHLACAHR